jgi:hypothetical protein
MFYRCNDYAMYDELLLSSGKKNTAAFAKTDDFFPHD